MGSRPPTGLPQAGQTPGFRGDTVVLPVGDGGGSVYDTRAPALAVNTVFFFFFFVPLAADAAADVHARTANPIPKNPAAAEEIVDGGGGSSEKITNEVMQLLLLLRR